ncbi:MAG: hypothetical protein LBE20_03400 [Deltaproteobacteria bacterium]|nr:hypothetical protein [Deltaproteobacteria bacterium]
MIKNFLKLSLLLILPVLLLACSFSEIPKNKVKRVGELPEDYSVQQRNYDAQKYEVESTKWGQAETKPYEQRYRDHEDPFIYQGNIK